MQPFLRLFIFMLLVTIELAGQAKASEYYYIYFNNRSDYLTETVTRTHYQCMHNAGPSSFSIPPGGSKTIQLEDSNNVSSGCANSLKKVEWSVTTSNSLQGTVSFNHYDCLRGTGLGEFCIIGEQFTGWDTEITSSSSLINSAFCDGVDCLNKSVNDNNSQPNITIDTLKQYQSQERPSHESECGRGYVVGVWINADGWNDWVVWLSKKGQSLANNDVKAYWAYSHSTTDYESGKAAYKTILSAQAEGQMVAVLDDASSPCSYRGASIYDGRQFDSVQPWYP